MILTTCDLRELAQILLNDLGNCIVVRIASLTVCEEGVGVFGGTTGDRTLWAHSTIAETLDVLFLYERTNILLIEQLNLVILVRGAETVEEVYERHAGLQRSEVSSGGHIHNLLYATFAEHSETSLAASHHVLVVTEDTERVRSQRTGRNVEYARNQLTGNLVHVRNHQEQTLRSSEGRGEGTSLQRTVNSTSSTSLRLHFLNTDGLTPQVLTTTCSPLVDMLRHWRRRGDGVDSSYLREHIAHVSRSLVTITGDKLLFFSHFNMINVLNEKYFPIPIS